MAENAFTITTDPLKAREFEQRNTDMVSLMLQIFGRLETFRSPYEPAWRDIQFLLDPHLVIWDLYQAGYPEFVTDLFITSKHLQSFDDLTSGLQEGITPASQTWMKYGLLDEESPLADDPDVWNYLHLATRRNQSILFKSNFYQQTPILYRSVSRFATGALMMERDPETYVRFTAYPIGSYFISNNNRGIVDTFGRKYMMTVRQIVEEFCTSPDGKVDISNLTSSTQTRWNNKAMREDKIPVALLIWPNPEFNPLKAKYDSKYAKYAVKYFEWGRNDGGKILREEGMPFFPVYCPRWYRQPTDSYGVDSPGYKARADIRRLFKTIEMWLNSMGKVLEPPMNADPSIAGASGGGLGSTSNFLNVVPGGAKGGNFGPAYQITPDLKAGQAFIDECKADIDRLCMADIFRRFGNDERNTPPTATEVLERVREDSRVLGPIFGAFNFDWLQRQATDLYWMMLEDGIIPPAPQQMHGQPLKVEVISRIAIALKQGDVQAINAGLGMAQAVANVKQLPGTEALNGDEILDHSFKVLDLPPKFLYAGKDLQRIRQIMNQQHEQQQKAAQAEQASKTAKNLGTAKAGDDTTLLQKMIEQNGGASPNGV